MDVEIRERDGVLIVTPKGRIIGSAGGELRQTLNEQIAQISGAPKVLFDLGDVSRIDSSGLGTLVATHVTIARKGGRTGIVNMGGGVQNLIVMGRLMTVFENFDSEDEAVAALSS
jgi:anti-sigma B factor antagonist